MLAISNISTLLVGFQRHVNPIVDFSVQLSFQFPILVLCYSPWIFEFVLSLKSTVALHILAKERISF